MSWCSRSTSQCSASSVRTGSLAKRVQDLQPQPPAVEVAQHGAAALGAEVECEEFGHGKSFPRTPADPAATVTTILTFLQIPPAATAAGAAGLSATSSVVASGWKRKRRGGTGILGTANALLPHDPTKNAEAAVGTPGRLANRSPDDSRGTPVREKVRKGCGGYPRPPDPGPFRTEPGRAPNAASPIPLPPDPIQRPYPPSRPIPGRLSSFSAVCQSRDLSEPRP